MELREELARNDGGSELLIQLHFFVVFVSSFFYVLVVGG